MTDLIAPSLDGEKEIRSKLDLTQAATAKLIHVSTKIWVKY